MSEASEVVVGLSMGLGNETVQSIISTISNAVSLAAPKTSDAVFSDLLYVCSIASRRFYSFLQSFVLVIVNPVAAIGDIL